MLTLAAPNRALLPFRAAMLADPATMSYNAPFSPPEGVIAFPESEWDAWLDRWTGHEPERFCAFLMDGDTPVGEVCWHEGGAHMGVVIAAQFRGRGYGAAGLQLLMAQAFDVWDLYSLCNDFEPDREPALSMHLHAGFEPLCLQSGILTLVLTRARYLADKRAAWIRAVYDAMCDWEAQIPLRIHHFVKVHSFSRQIAQQEGLSPEALFTLEVAALTHDIAIRPSLEQFGNDAGPNQERLGPPEAWNMLRALGLPVDVIGRVCYLIGHHHTLTGVNAIDWQILLEADFLVNMIEGNHSQAAIDRMRAEVFRTAEGLRLLDRIRP